MLQSYFAAFYFSINAGSFISTLVTPKLRADVQCFGRDDCFPAAFGVPGLLMFIATVIFLSGKRLYVMKKPDRNVTGDFARAVWVSISSKVARISLGPAALVVVATYCRLF
jgi:dipeptide/tripeptide permease